MSGTHPIIYGIIAVLLILLVAGSGQTTPMPASPPPQQQRPAWPEAPPVASYDITVTLDPQTHTLMGHETITYHNRSQDALPYLVFHLYMNAFRGNDTVFMRESDPASGGAHRGFGYNPQYPGWAKVDSLHLTSRLMGVPMTDPVDLLPDTIINETLMTTTLPLPLRPGEVLTLTLDFQVRLPQVFARTGFADNFHMVGQWFPKLAVYREGKGWNAHPFHANSEFFADLGTYDVAITVPEGYVVGATGLPNGRATPPDGTVIHYFHAESVIDFAWTAWPRFKQASRQVGPTEVILLYDPAHEALAQRYLDAATHALTAYGEWYGPYAYPRLTLVDVPDIAGGAGGMEYPTLVTVGTMGIPLPDTVENLFPELVTVHEIAHQWWQSTVATNEFEEPWLDEGLAEYSGVRLLDLAYGSQQPLLRLGPLSLSALDLDRLSYVLNPATPMVGRAWDFTTADYAVAAYAKPTMVWTTLERILGEEQWLNVLRTYNERYRFRHPTTEDLLAVIAEVAGEDVRAYIEPLAYGDGLVDYAVTTLDCEQDEDSQHCEVTVARLGEVALPVEVEIAFADGTQIREDWDGREAQIRYVYTKSVASAHVDPDRQLYLDVSFQNNSLTRQVQVKPMLRISSWWFCALEQLILILGGVW